MSSAASRFRRLPPPQLHERVRSPEENDPTQEPVAEAPPTAGLFEHFGVPLDEPRPEPPSMPSMPSIAARPCPGCGWWQRCDRAPTCEVCGSEVPPT